MPIIRRVFGPFHPEVHETYDQNVKRIVIDEARWYFHGIRGDKKMAHWVLVYDTGKRTFLARNIPLDAMVGSRNRTIARHLPKGGVDETVNPDLWLDDSPVMEGSVTEMLKSKLPAAEIAKATALALARR